MQAYKMATFLAFPSLNFHQTPLSTFTSCMSGKKYRPSSRLGEKRGTGTSFFRLSQKNRVNSTERLTADTDDTGVFILCVLKASLFLKLKLD